MERPFVRFSIQHIARHSPDETAQANMCDNIDKVYRPTPPPPLSIFLLLFLLAKFFVLRAMKKLILWQPLTLSNP